MQLRVLNVWIPAYHVVDNDYVEYEILFEAERTGGDASARFQKSVSTQIFEIAAQHSFFFVFFFWRTLRKKKKMEEHTSKRDNNSCLFFDNTLF